MKKSELKCLIKEVVEEMAKTKTYRVYADIPGAGWEEIVKAGSPEEAKRKANKGKSQQSDGIEEVPDNYQDTKNKEDAIRSQYSEELRMMQARHRSEEDALLRKYRGKF